jgi:hypothetical protein
MCAVFVYVVRIVNIVDHFYGLVACEPVDKHGRHYGLGPFSRNILALCRALALNCRDSDVN